MEMQLRNDSEWKNEFTANGDTEILWLVVTNPKRSYGKSYARFEQYFGSSTVSEYLANGGTKGDLKHDWKHRFLSLYLPETETVAPVELLTGGAPEAEEPLPVLTPAEEEFAEFARFDQPPGPIGSELAEPIVETAEPIVETAEPIVETAEPPKPVIEDPSTTRPMRSRKSRATAK
jgi:hypothetical protein